MHIRSSIVPCNRLMLCRGEIGTSIVLRNTIKENCMTLNYLMGYRKYPFILDTDIFSLKYLLTKALTLIFLNVDVMQVLQYFSSSLHDNMRRWKFYWVVADIKPM